MLLAAALLLDAALGEPKWLWSRLPHPAVVMGRAVARIERHLNRGPARRLKGVVALVALVLPALVLGWGLERLGLAATIPAAAILLAQRSLVEHVRAVGAALRRSVDQGRRMVARIVSRDCRQMDRAQVARAAIESAAENLSDGVVAPALWFLVGGLPGLVAYKAINTADSMIGYRNERYARFGWAAARADDVLNYIPARLTGLLIAALTGRLRDWPGIARDAARHRSPNAGWPEAAMARALGVALAGPRSYDGRVRDLAWVNEGGRKRIGPDDIDRAVTILWRVWFGLLVLSVASGLLLSLV